MDCICSNVVVVALGLAATLRRCWMSLAPLHVQIGPHRLCARDCCMIGSVPDVPNP